MVQFLFGTRFSNLEPKISRVHFCYQAPSTLQHPLPPQLLHHLRRPLLAPSQPLSRIQSLRSIKLFPRRLDPLHNTLHPRIVIFGHSTDILFLYKLDRRFRVLASLKSKRHPGLDVAGDLENVAGLVRVRLNEDGVVVARCAKGGDKIDWVGHCGVKIG
jgi:hypothetical protein